MKKALMFMLFVAVSIVFADQWSDETVKVLISKEEKDEYKKLKTDAEKQKFVADFWAKRDPSPGTPENEFKKAYEDRLKTINEKLKGGSKKPVDTDMGKAVLLLGGSTEQKEEKGDNPKQTWIWRGLPKEMGVGDVEIKFEGDEESGGFVFSDPNAANAILDKARDYLSKLSSMGQAASPTPSTAPAAPSQPTGGAVTTPAVKAALDAAASGSPGKDFTLEVLGDSFMTSEGQLFAAVGIKCADAGSAKVGVRLLDASGAIAKETELAFASAQEKAGYFQTTLPVTAGEYSLVVAVSDGTKSGGAKKQLSVPEYGAKLSISSLIFVGEFQQLNEGAPEMVAYTFGKTKIIPSFDHVYQKSGDLRILYEIYSAQNDATTGKANLEESVKFQKEGGKAKQSTPAPPQGFAIGKKTTVPTGFPLGTFEPGQYKLILTVTDKSNGQTATQEATFTVQ